MEELIENIKIVLQEIETGIDTLDNNYEGDDIPVVVREDFLVAFK